MTENELKELYDIAQGFIKNAWVYDNSSDDAGPQDAEKILYLHRAIAYHDCSEILLTWLLDKQKKGEAGNGTDYQD